MIDNLTLKTAPVWLSVGFRFYSCLSEAVHKTDSTSFSQLPTCSADAAEGNVTAVLNSDRTEISAETEEARMSSPVACQWAMDSTDTFSLCDLFE